MGDLSEEDELEPLFDYTRVQPVSYFNLDDDDDDDDDDSDSSPSSLSKRRKLSKFQKGIEEGKTVEVIDCDEIDEKENWLPPPPPKSGAPSSKIYEDSTIKELRLRKQELASLVQSTEDALRAAEEIANGTFNTSIPYSTEKTVEEIPEPAADRTKIVISIQDKNGTKQCRIFADERFELIFKGYANKANIDVNKLVFTFDGDRIDPASTPQTIGMEEDDIIEVHVKTS